MGRAKQTTFLAQIKVVERTHWVDCFHCSFYGEHENGEHASGESLLPALMFCD